MDIGNNEIESLVSFIRYIAALDNPIPCPHSRTRTHKHTHTAFGDWSAVRVDGIVVGYKSPLRITRGECVTISRAIQIMQMPSIEN